MDNLLRKCDYCGTDNLDNARECKQCGLELPKVENKDKNNRNSRNAIIIFIIVITLIISFSGYYIFSERTEDIELPKVILESVVIDKIEPDWLDNTSRQVGATAYFKLINSNEFNVDIKSIDYSIFVQDNRDSFRIYDGSLTGGLLPAKGSIQKDQSFWFISSIEGVEDLQNQNLSFRVQGIAEFQTITESSTIITVPFDSEE